MCSTILLPTTPMPSIRNTTPVQQFSSALLSAAIPLIGVQLALGVYAAGRATLVMLASGPNFGNVVITDLLVTVAVVDSAAGRDESFTSSICCQVDKCRA
jgi:hypothetical protein